MAGGITVLITGAGRGLGKGLVAVYLSQPGNTVIATARNPSDAVAQSLTTLPTGAGSTLIIIQLEATSPTSIAGAVESLSAHHGVTHLDVVIANAGNALGVGALSTLDPATTIQQNVDLHAYGPLWLFQQMLPLLRKAPRQPVFAAMSSLMGSIALLDHTGRIPLGPYAVSKTILNAIVKRLAIEEDDVVTVALDPGVVGTEGAIASARTVGIHYFEHISVEESVAGLTKVIADATKEKSGHFIKYTGEETPW